MGFGFTPLHKRPVEMTHSRTSVRSSLKGSGRMNSPLGFSKTMTSSFYNSKLKGLPLVTTGLSND
jgi:hypothetical protein